MRRIPPISVVACACLALAGCGGGDDGAKDKTALDGRGPITFGTGKDRSGNLSKQVDAWNREHAAEKVRIVELPDEPNDQRQQLVQNATARSDAYAVLNLACDKVRKLPEGKDVDCYFTEVDKTESMTISAVEAIASAGGTIAGEDGEPTLTTPQARQGVQFLVDAKKDRMPKAAVTLDTEGGRRYFQSGKLLFQRQWPYQYALAQADDGSSEVAGEFAVAPLPGPNGPGIANLGGHDLAVSAFAKNKATSLDFIRYLTGEQAQRANLLATSQAPTVAALYDDPEMVRRFPYLPVLKQAIATAEPRPVAVKYGDVTAAVQGELYEAVTGKKPVDKALSDLQAELQPLTAR